MKEALASDPMLIISRFILETCIQMDWEGHFFFLYYINFAL